MSRKRRRGPSHPRSDVAAASASDVPAASERAAAGGGRIAAIDALRGGALCLMFVYHFAFDLRFYGITHADFEHDPFWLCFRAFIVGAFMTLVGVSLVLAERAGSTPGHFWRRIAVIAGCALLATLASRVLFPHTFIYFGILHAIAVASVLAWPLVGRPRVALVVGAAIVTAGVLWSHPMFDARPLSWIGFATEKPATEDYVPLAPWAGVVAIGIAVGHWFARGGFRPIASLSAAPAWLRWLGRHSLLVYMVHQPLLLGALWLAVRR